MNPRTQNLRQALFQIRRCLDKDAILLHGKNSLELNPKFGFGSEWDLPEADFALRQDRFLDFFYLKDCPEFEVWVENKRDVSSFPGAWIILNQSWPSLWSAVI